MQLNFEKRNLKSCNGSLRFIKKGSKWQISFIQFIVILCLCCNLIQFCAHVAIQCNFAIITAIFLKKKRFWPNILCNLMQFCVQVAIKCNFLVIFLNKI